MSDLDGWVGRLRDGLRARRDADAELVDLVMGARADGVTWQAIADALGLPLAVVHRLYAGLARQRGVGRLHAQSLGDALLRAG